MGLSLFCGVLDDRCNWKESIAVEKQGNRSCGSSKWTERALCSSIYWFYHPDDLLYRFITCRNKLKTYFTMFLAHFIFTIIYFYLFNHIYISFPNTIIPLFIAESFPLTDHVVVDLFK